MGRRLAMRALPAQKATEPSRDPLASTAPEGVKATLVTSSSCPASLATSSPRSTPKMRTHEPLPVATRLPSGDHAADESGLSCPSKVESPSPLSASQMPALLSVDAVSRRLPSGEYAIDVTLLE